MIEEKATVIARAGRRVQVETQVKTTCNACQVNQDCGTGVVAKALTPKTQQFWLDTDDELFIGQQVTIGIPEHRILTASLLLYLFPLMVLIAAIMLLQSVLPEWMALLIGLSLTAISYLPVRGYFRRHEMAYQPRFLRAAETQLETPIQQFD